MDPSDPSGGLEDGSDGSAVDADGSARDADRDLWIKLRLIMEEELTADVVTTKTIV